MNVRVKHTKQEVRVIRWGTVIYKIRPSRQGRAKDERRIQAAAEKYGWTVVRSSHG